MVDIYADEGTSGANIEYRTNFKKLIEDAKNGKFEVIIFTKLSRLARNTREYLNLFHELQGHRVNLVSIKENFDPTTSTGRAMATIFASFAEFERETIKEQMHENKMVRWREQRIFNGKPPYAYFWNKESKQLDINQEEANVYHTIVDMYLNQKMSFQDISIKLKNQGIKCKRAYWSSTTISYTLKNPAYYGNYVVNQYIYEDGARGAGTKRTKQKKPTSENIHFSIPPLISKNQWDKIQDQIDFNKFKSKRSNKTKDFILRDVLICGRCGGRVKPRVGNVRKDGTAPRYYGCYWAGTSKKNLIATGRNTKCSLPYIPSKSIESTVWTNILMRFVLNPNKTLKWLSKTNKHNDTINQLKKTINTLKSGLTRKERAKNNLYILLEEDDTNIDDLKERLNLNNEAIISLKGNLNETQTKYQELVTINKNKKQIANFLDNNKKLLRKLRKDISTLNIEDRKLLIESSLTDKIIVNYQEDNEIDGPGGPTYEFKLSINVDTLQMFMQDGKIINLNQNSTHNPSRYEF